MHYKPAPQDDDALRLALIRLAKQYGQYGYCKVGELLAVEGWHVNHKKVERLWREDGLQLPHRHMEAQTALPPRRLGHTFKAEVSQSCLGD
jgi:putative transposase